MKIYNLTFLLLFSCLFSCKQAVEIPKASNLTDSLYSSQTNTTATAYMVFRSADGGLTWQDISKGLPEPVMDDHGFVINAFYADDNGLYLTNGNWIYRSNKNSSTPFWAKNISPDKHSNNAPGKTRISTYNYWGVNLRKANGTSIWSPIFEKSQGPRLRSTFETAAGTIFIGTDEGIFKTDNSGKTWKLVYTGFVGHLAEANGVLLAIGMQRIIRSIDNGENWSRVISVDSVAFDVKPIRDGLAAITSNSYSNTVHTSRLSTSYDGGKTWQPINAGPQNKGLIDSIWRTWNDRPRVQAFMTSIIQVGENFFCSHPEGVFRSSDKGKTWKLLLPSIKGKVFRLSVSGNVIYAIAGKGGC